MLTHNEFFDGANNYRMVDFFHYYKSVCWRQIINLPFIHQTVKILRSCYYYCIRSAILELDAYIYIIVIGARYFIQRSREKDAIIFLQINHLL